MALTASNRHLLVKKQKATLTRAPSKKYRQEGLTFLTGNGARRTRVYDNDAKIIAGLEFIGRSPISKGMTRKQQAAGYHLDQFAADNFFKPYKNMGHHLVPCECFQDPKLFPEDPLSILRAVDYDVNEGRNIIFLPGYSDGFEILRSELNWSTLGSRTQENHRQKWKRESLRSANLHKLPCHWDFHKKYTGLVKLDMNTLRNRLKAQVKKFCKDWNPPASIPKQLRKLEDDYWEYVVKFGESRPLGKAASIDALIKQFLKPKKGLGR
ncbi:AHH domain-containing protein [Corallococcus terminator]